MGNSFFLILGMHRSGTSCLTGALERCGVYLGEVRRTGKHNKKGYFEKGEVARIQDQILGLNLGSWHEPPAHYPIIHPIHAKKLEVITNQLKIKMPCGLKDPRTLLLLDFWKSLIGERIQLIGTFRHPMAVAQSLHTRNQFSIEKGIQLWIAYNKILVQEHKKNPFPLIQFDLSKPKLYRKNLTHLAKKFGLRPQYLRLRLFISKDLEHNKMENLELPIACKDLYQYLIQNQILAS